MSLSLTPSKIAVAPNVPYPFLALGGTSPYTYSVIAGGAGGSIDSFGVYTAPATTGRDTVKVVDSLGAIATSIVSVLTAIELFCDVLQTEMGLDDGRVYLWDQKINAPTDDDIFIAVAALNPKPFANKNEILPDDTFGMIEVQSVNMKTTLSVDIISRNLEAMNRKEEVIMAATSVYSQNQQSLNSFYIAPITSNFVNLSQIDGAAIPYRFNLSINIQYVVTKRKAVSYYDDFSAAGVTTEP